VTRRASIVDSAREISLPKGYRYEYACSAGTYSEATTVGLVGSAEYVDVVDTTLDVPPILNGVTPADVPPVVNFVISTRYCPVVTVPSEEKSNPIKAGEDVAPATRAMIVLADVDVAIAPEVETN
jgi:hypothetical protein